MPVKRRRGKRKLDPVTEAQAWACAFHCGHDFFGDLAEYGFPQGPGDDRAIQAAMPEAWGRLGRIFLDRGMGDDFNGEPWALEQFGEPETCR